MNENSAFFFSDLPSSLTLSAQVPFSVSIADNYMHEG